MAAAFTAGARLPSRASGAARWQTQQHGQHGQPAHQQQQPVSQPAAAGARPTAADVNADPNAAQLRKHGSANPETVVGYWNKFERLQEYCREHGWDPFTFSIELAVLFACSMMNRIWAGKYIQAIDDYFAAFNHCYDTLGKGKPWAGGAITGLKAAFKKAQKERARDAGMKVGSLRIAVPFSLIEAMLAKSELANGADLAYFGLFWIMLLFLFRADTMGGIISADSDIRFLGDGSLSFMVRRLKRGTAHLQPFTRTIPAPGAHNHIRKRVFAVIKRALALRDPEAPTQPMIRRGFLGNTPSKASDELTKAMDKLLVSGMAEAFMMGEGSHISSHSWRKAGASALAAAGATWQAIKLWGMWASTLSAERYIDNKYTVGPDVRLLFDWILAFGQTTPAIPASAQYTVSDEADDGVCAATT